MDFSVGQIVYTIRDVYGEDGDVIPSGSGCLVQQTPGLLSGKYVVKFPGGDTVKCSVDDLSFYDPAQGYDPDNPPEARRMKY